MIGCSGGDGVIVVIGVFVVRVVVVIVGDGIGVVIEDCNSAFFVEHLV